MFKVAITTYDRPECFAKVYSELLKYVPKEDIIIVGDNNPDYIDCDYSFPDRVGIPRSKNKCIELFMQTDSEYLFMLDDDTYPIHEEAFSRYIESNLNHACYTFYKNFRKHDGYRSFRLVNGCMMFFTRKCFETVGGMDTTFFSAYEHVEYSRRIFNAGLTPDRFIDIYSEGLFYCKDEHPKHHKRSFNDIEKSKLLKDGKNHFHKTFNRKDYISYI